LKLDQHHENGVTIIAVNGRIDTGEDTARLLQTFICLPSEQVKKVVLDLSKLLMVSAAGLNTLSHCYGHIVTHGGRLAFVGQPGDVLPLIRRLGLRGNVPHYGSNADAIAVLSALDYRGAV